MAEVILPALLVALATVLLLRRYADARLHPAEVLLPFLVSPAVALAVGCASRYALTADTEYLGTWIARAAYQEPWTERETVIDYCERTTTDPAGRTATERYPCGSHVEYRDRGDDWWVETGTGKTIAVDRHDYASLLALFGTHERRAGHHDDVDREDGYRSAGEGYLHVTTWPGTDATLRPATVVHTWTNRVQAAERSLFHRERVDAEDVARYGLVPYPPVRDYYLQDALLTARGPLHGAANTLLMKANARLGPARQLRLFVLLFEDQPYEAALKQEAYWEGGNKNEFILCVGADRGGAVRWAHVISWCEDERLKVDVRDFARGMGAFDPAQLAGYLERTLGARFRRKEFKDFDYLDVAVPAWGQATSLLACLLANAGLALWAVRNGLDGGGPTPHRRRTPCS